MRPANDLFVVLFVTLALTACAQRNAPGTYVVVGMTNSALDVDSRVGADEAAQKAHQLLFDSLVSIRS